MNSPSLPPSVQKTPFKDHISVYIRDCIFNGTLKPGEHIVTARIAEELGVGRGAIREALFELESLGLVENYPYRGSFVKKISPDELEEICSVRVLLETYAIRFLGAISEADFSVLEAITADMEEACSRNDYQAFVHSDSLFHGYFVRKANKSVLFNTWDACSSKISLLLYSLLCKDYPFAESPKRHRELLNILKAHPGNVSVYEAALQIHYMIIPTYSKSS